MVSHWLRVHPESVRSEPLNQHATSCNRSTRLAQQQLWLLIIEYKYICEEMSTLEKALKQLTSMPDKMTAVRSLQTLREYIGNVVDLPGEERFHEISTVSPTFLRYIQPVEGAREILHLLHFEQDGTSLRLNSHFHIEELQNCLRMIHDVCDSLLASAPELV